MQLGLGSYACAWAIGVPGYPQPAHPLDAIGLIERAAQLDLHLVQIADNLPLEELAPSQVSDIRAVSRENRVQLELGTRGIHPRHLARYISLCEMLDCRLLRIVVDKEAHQPSPGEIIGTLRPLIGLLTKSRVTLAIENHDRLAAQTLADIVTALATPFIGVCLDTVNSLGSLECPEFVVNVLAPLVANVHAKDFIIRRAPHQMGFEITGTPAGQGRVNYPWLFDKVTESGRDPNIILELWPPPEPDIEATVAKECEWGKRSIAYLSQLLESRRAPSPAVAW